jgi:hypothetical protein
MYLRVEDAGVGFVAMAGKADARAPAALLVPHGIPCGRDAHRATGRGVLRLPGGEDRPKMGAGVLDGYRTAPGS